MRRFFAIVVLCAVPLTAFSHPGKTDRHGGHKCLKRCEDWGLLYGEYHLHDKEGRAIRLRREKGGTRAALRSAAAETTPLATSATRTVTVYRTITTIYRESVFSTSPLLWALLPFLLLVLILLRGRRKSDDPKKS
jgi:hypothetical protein